MVEERRGTKGWNKRRTAVYSLVRGIMLGTPLLWACATHLQRVQTLKPMGALADFRVHIDSVVAPW